VQFRDFSEKYQKASASESGNGLSMFDDKYLFTCTQLVQVQALAQFILDGKNRVPFIFDTSTDFQNFLLAIIAI